ncbi:MAG: tetratricopeptide repeat protein [Spirochaetaceae bacterium]|jgi:tetratricopeptide (TPR) repeat protein|nr:tetratricopeptide repeat protein [Spirochaetaceae bacterium]
MKKDNFQIDFFRFFKYRLTVIQRYLTVWVFIMLTLGCNQITERLVATAFNRNQGIDPYYITGSKTDREAFAQLFLLLAKETEPGETRFAVVREIAGRYARLKEYHKLINFLTAQISRYPDDPYNAYYLHMTAYAYKDINAEDVAVLYFNRIINNYPDLMVRGQPIHLDCLQHLISRTDNPELQVLYYKELIARFSDKIDLGEAYFKLAYAYEGIGEWNEAIQAYTQYRPYIGKTGVPGFPDADYHAKQLVDFNNSPKDWTFETLDALVAAIKEAIDAENSAKLRQYQAKVNFFARSWAQDTDDSGMAEFSLSAFMSRGRIRYADTLDAGSNAAEAYLQTTGWDQYITTWYLYFRKVYFPLDPKIHGRWEWAGIYYGEKL